MPGSARFHQVHVLGAEDDLIRALRDLLGAESVHYVKAG